MPFADTGLAMFGQMALDLGPLADPPGILLVLVILAVVVLVGRFVMAMAWRLIVIGVVVVATLWVLGILGFETGILSLLPTG